VANELTVTQPLLYRVLRIFGLVGVREEGQAEHIAGADFSSGHPAERGFSAINSLSSVAAFPWVHAAMNAISSDMSGLPLRVRQGTGANAEPVDDHPVLALLNRPSSRVSGVLLRRQLVTDLVLTGDAFLLVAGATQPEVLMRLHPHRMRIVPMEDGQPGHYEYRGGGVTMRYEWEQVLHFRQTSWEDDPKGLYGNGAIRALASDLTTDKLAADLAAASSSTGRPTTVFSPSEEGDRWSSEQIRVLRQAYERQMSGTSGALFLGGAAKMESLSWSPRDMEYGSVRDGVRAAILGVFDVPPTRVGLPSANYATSREQAKRYYEGLMGRSAMIDGELTRLARMFPGWEQSDVEVYHDFGGVDALAESRDSRVRRVMDWTLMGLSLEDAAAFEGFDDLPVDEVPEDDGAPVADTGEGAATAATPADQPMAATALNGAQVASLLAIIGQVSLGTLSVDAAVALILAAFPTVSEGMARRIVAGAQAAPAPEPAPAPAAPAQMSAEDATLSRQSAHKTLEPQSPDAQASTARKSLVGSYSPPVTEEARAQVWRQTMGQLHDPIQATYQRAMMKYLRGAGKRISARAKQHLGQKGGLPTVVRADTMDKILDVLKEAQLLKSILRKPMRDAYQKAAVNALSMLPSDWDVKATPDRVYAMADKDMDRLVKLLEKDTAAAVKKAITEGLAEGSTMSQMQLAIEKSRGFAPSRALTVAQTETTRTVTQGTVQAYEQTVAAGHPMKMEWLSARDNHVRDVHRELDSHAPIEPGEEFVTASGHGTKGPGLFGTAALDINCRCTLLPVVVRK